LLPWDVKHCRMFGRRAIVCHKSIDLSLKVSCQNSCIMAEYIAAGIQMQQYAHRDDSVMFRDDMEEVFSRSPVETYTECLALSLFIDKQAGTLNLRMSQKSVPIFKRNLYQVIHRQKQRLKRNVSQFVIEKWATAGTKMPVRPALR